MDSERQTPISYSSWWLWLCLAKFSRYGHGTNRRRQTNDSVARGVPRVITDGPPNNVLLLFGWRSLQLHSWRWVMIDSQSLERKATVWFEPHTVRFLMIQFLPSVLWYCWLGLLTCKNRLPYNLYCVGGDVKHCLMIQFTLCCWSVVTSIHWCTVYRVSCLMLLNVVLLCHCHQPFFYVYVVLQVFNMATGITRWRSTTCLLILLRV